MLDLLTNKMAGLNITKRQARARLDHRSQAPARCRRSRPPGGFYHEFDHPYEMMDRICLSLKPGGRVVFVEFRGEDPPFPSRPSTK